MKERLNYIDIYKGIGIILMILGHISFGSLFQKITYAFHMPMFFFISGYLYNKNHINSNSLLFIKKKAKTLLIPYLSFGIIHYLIWIFFNNDNLTLTPLLNLLFVSIDGLVIETALWFLISLFFTETIYFILDKYLSDKKYIKISLIIILSLIGISTPTLSSFRLPWGLDSALVGLLFFYGGIYIREKEILGSKITNLKLSKIIFYGIVILILILFNGIINMRKGEYCIIPLFMINAFGASILLLNLVKILDRCNNKIIKVIKSFLSKIGTHSIIYVCLNHITILIATFLINFIPLPLLLQKIIIFILTMIILNLIKKLINGTALKILIGKF